MNVSRAERFLPAKLLVMETQKPPPHAPTWVGMRDPYLDKWQMEKSKKTSQKTKKPSQ